MSSKPKVFSLSRSSAKFVFSNLETLGAQIMLIFPATVGLQGMVKFGNLYNSHQLWDDYLVSAIVLYLYACFSLAWHRTSLSDGTVTKAVNPFWPGKDALKFIGMFMVIMGGLFLLTKGIDYFEKNYEPWFPKKTRIAIDIGIVAAIFFVMIEFIRFCYFLPAQALRVTLGWKEAAKTSKGTVWPLAGSTLIFFIIFFVAVSAYMMISVSVVMISSGGRSTDNFTSAVTGFILAIPIHLSAFFMTAMFVTALSKAYLWGRQTNI